MSQRIYNFSAGPAVLPFPVLEKAQSELLSLNGIGMSVMEVSHRSKHFAPILESAESNLRELFSDSRKLQNSFPARRRESAIFDDSAEFSRQKTKPPITLSQARGAKKRSKKRKNAEMRKRSFRPKTKVLNQFRRRKN